MSTRIMALCWPLQLPPTAKAVLISLADNANDAGECWPSIPTIAERTCLSERSVIRAIQELETFQVMRADRSNGRHTRYVLTPETYQQPVTQSHQCQSVTSDTESITSDTESPDPCHRVMGPVTQSHSNHQGTVKNHQEPSALDVLEKVNPELLRDFKAMRKKAKAPITETAMKGFMREAKKAGMSLEQAVEMATERSWRGFRADWVTGGKQPQAKHTDSAEDTKRRIEAANQGTRMGVPDHLKGVVAQLTGKKAE